MDRTPARNRETPLPEDPLAVLKKQHAEYRAEIRSSVKHIEREAKRDSPPRRIGFFEAALGSKTYSNMRFRDNKTQEILSENITYDPSLFWDAPAGAFYAALWHEYGHGERRYERMEDEDKKTFAGEIKAFPEPGESKEHSRVVHDLLNVKYDIMLDAGNLKDRPGLIGPYRALYEVFFPRTLPTRESSLTKIATAAGLSSIVAAIGSEIERAVRRPFLLLIAAKHEAYWDAEDKRRGIPEAERPANPYTIADPKLAESFEAIRSAVLEVADPRRGIPSRSTKWNHEVAPVYFETVRAVPVEVEAIIAQAVASGNATLVEFGTFADALELGDLASLLAVGMNEGAAKMSAETPTTEPWPDASNLPKTISVRPPPENVAEAAARILEALSKRPPEKGEIPDHPVHVDVPIDPNHPEHPDHKKEPPKPQERTGDPGQRSLEDLSRTGITPADHKEFLRVMQNVERADLDDLGNGLIRMFSEDRERVILTNRPVGRLPTARKAEALRRRYGGEALPEVREIRKTAERFMGVDLIVVNDHSGSMEGVKEDAAKAANISLAFAARRTNDEIRRRMLRHGLSDADVRKSPPIRYLDILFSNTAAAINQRGWTEPLSGGAAEIDEQELRDEKFVTDLFAGYRKMAMSGTYDSLAAAFALREAFGKEFPQFTKPEARVKVFCFITDGVGDTGLMTALMTFLHGKSDEFPVLMTQLLDAIEPGCAPRVEARLRQYKDQIFAIAIGIPDNEYEGVEQMFLNVYNEGKKPDLHDVRVFEEHNAAIVRERDVRTLPHTLLRMLQAKFGSPKFRRVRAKFASASPAGGRTERILGK